MRLLTVLLLCLPLVCSAAPHKPRAVLKLDWECAQQVWGYEVPNELHEKVLARAEESFQKAEAFYHRKFERTPILYGYMMGFTAAGGYYSAGNFIMFNEVYLNKYQQRFLDEVVPHEVAHSITGQIYGFDHDHDEMWNKVVHDLGFKHVTKYHDYTLCFNKHFDEDFPNVGPSFAY